MSDEKTIFTEALSIGSPEGRQAFIECACGGNATLRGQVQGLIDAHERAGSFLESPPPGAALTTAASDPALDLAGTTIGHYKLLERIGEGGMGVVYMADQLHPVRRRVALKIIKPGLDTRQVIARFEAERQALAMMDHPSIAKVFEAGATDTGRPYFVMELVRGVLVTEYCDEHHLTPRQRLELFVQVCQAVQHAHQKGIIHRDLKPNNVLVTLGDGDKPIPKVIDFGIAKATGEQRLTDRTLFTEFRQLIGTPLYMSPEQAEMSQLADVDTRSDVYSLGVLLYELLTGTTPFDKQRLAKAAYDEVRRIIREEEPPRPSTRLSTLGQTISSISAQRQTDPKKLSQTVRGELDWIVMKALEKERTRRYETANGLARDVERYLANQPVEACPPSRTYRLRTFLRRNKVWMTTAAVIAVVLILATAISTWQAIRATRARDAESRQRALAEQATTREAAERKDAQAVARLLETVFKSFDPLMRRDDPDGLRRLLVEKLDKAAEDLERDQEIQPLTRARLRNTLGWVELRLGEDATGQALVRSALDEQVAHAPDDPQTLTMMHNLALAYDHMGRSDEAIKLFEQVRDRRTRKLGPDDPSTLLTLNDLGCAYQGAGRYSDSLNVLEEALKRKTRVLGPDDGETMATRANLASAYWKGGRLDDAIRLFEQVRARNIELGGDEDYPQMWTILGNLAGAYTDSHRYADAIAVLENLRDRQVQQLGPDNTGTIAMVLKLVDAYVGAGRTADAIRMGEEEVQRTTRKFGPTGPLTLSAKAILAWAYLAQGEPHQAIPLYEEVVDQRTKTLGPENPDTLGALKELAAAYQSDGQTDKARQVLKRSRQFSSPPGTAPSSAAAAAKTPAASAPASSSQPQ